MYMFLYTFYLGLGSENNRYVHVLPGAWFWKQQVCICFTWGVVLKTTDMYMFYLGLGSENNRYMFYLGLASENDRYVNVLPGAWFWKQHSLHMVRVSENNRYVHVPLEAWF